MKDEDKFLLAMVVVTLFALIAMGIAAYTETHTPKYYIDFQNKRYELKEIK